MLAPAEVVGRFMATFVEAWPSGDARHLAAFFSEDAVYHNIPLEAVQGRRAIRAALEGFMAMGGHVEVGIANVVVDHDRVVVERVDTFVDAHGARSLPMMGIFEVRDGLIEAWRDYFDPSQFRRS